MEKLGSVQYGSIYFKNADLNRDLEYVIQKYVHVQFQMMRNIIAKMVGTYVAQYKYSRPHALQLKIL